MLARSELASEHTARETKLTKREVLAEFREHIAPNIPKGDKPAMREAWNNYTDALCKDKRITLHQYETWTNPF